MDSLKNFFRDRFFARFILGEEAPCNNCGELTGRRIAQHPDVPTCSDEDCVAVANILVFARSAKKAQMEGLVATTALPMAPCVGCGAVTDRVVKGHPSVRWCGKSKCRLAASDALYDDERSLKNLLRSI